MARQFVAEYHRACGHAAYWRHTALAAGVDPKRLDIAGEQGRAIMDVLVAVLEDLDVPPPDPSEDYELMARSIVRGALDGMGNAP